MLTRQRAIYLESNKLCECLSSISTVGKYDYLVKSTREPLVVTTTQLSHNIVLATWDDNQVFLFPPPHVRTLR